MMLILVETDFVIMNAVNEWILNSNIVCDRLSPIMSRLRFDIES